MVAAPPGLSGYPHRAPKRSLRRTDGLIVHQHNVRDEATFYRVNEPLIRELKRNLRHL